MRNLRRLVPLALLAFTAACVPMGMMRWGWSRFSDTYASNGERIYFTATSERGTVIRPIGGFRFGGMMMGRLTCASCHGPDGRGGTHVMHMDVMEAPDIRWRVLASGEHGGHGDGEEHADEHGEAEAYDEEAFARALREGIAPGGHQLSPEMPRWQISDEDLKDLIEFLKTLP